MHHKYIFDELLAFLGQNRIGLPCYSIDQDLISEALNAERHRIINILSNKITDFTTKEINSVLHDDGKLNEIRGYSASAKNFSPSEIDRELCTHNSIGDIYYEVKEIIKSLGISQGNIN